MKWAWLMFIRLLVIGPLSGSEWLGHFPQLFETIGSFVCVYKIGSIQTNKKAKK